MKKIISKMLSLIIASAILIAPVIAAAPVSTALASGTNLVVNGNFSAGMSPWWSYGTGVTFDTSGGDLAVTVPSGLSNPWDAGFGQDGIALVNGTEYQLQFTASAVP